MQSILIVEDEIKIANVISDYLKQSGYRTNIINNGSEAVDWVRKNHCELILLDLMLPGKGGLDICKEIREFSTVPIIIVTAKTEDIDKLLGLELGADDYICKPFNPREVLARVKVILRRESWKNEPNTHNDKFALDEDKYQLCVNGTRTDLTAVEFQILKALTSPPGRILSRQQLMDRIYSDYRVVSNRTIDSHIKNVRRKLNEADPEQEYLHSIYGVGYKMEL